MSELAPELDARLLAIEAALAAAEAGRAGISADIAALDSKQTADTAAIIDAIAESEEAVLLGQQAIMSAVGAAGETMKAIQFDSSAESLTVATGTSLDNGSGALDPCTVIFGCRPNASSVDIVTNATSLNGSGILIQVISGKMRGYAGSASGNQKRIIGTASWAQGDAHWGSYVWDGSNITLSQDGATDSVTNTTRNASPGYLDDLRFNQGDDDQDVWAMAFIRKALTQSEINALYAQIASGDLTGAAAVINAHNAASGMLVGPTADDDTTTSAGVVEWTNGRFTQVVGSPALIDIPT